MENKQSKPVKVEDDAEAILQRLVYLKIHKERHGKDDYYEENQPLVWVEALQYFKNKSTPVKVEQGKEAEEILDKIISPFERNDDKTLNTYIYNNVISAMKIYKSQSLDKAIEFADGKINEYKKFTYGVKEGMALAYEEMKSYLQSLTQLCL